MTADDQWRLTRGRRRYETVAMATVRLGKDPRTMKRIFERSGIKPDGHFDARTPVYLVANVDKMMRDRIGRGAPGVPKPKRTGQDAAA